MRDETYNGWTNWDTWAVNLWLTNEQEAHESAQAAARSSDLDLDAFADYAFSTGLRKARCTDKDDLSKFRVNWKEVREALAGDGSING